MAERKGVRFRPTVERERLRNRVVELRKEGMSYGQIIGKIREESGVVLNKSHVSEWVTGKHEPFGYVRRFLATPSPELAYLVGVKWGDASTNTNRNHMHMIKLRVKDRDFAEEFSRCLSVVLKRSPPRVRWNGRTSAWHTELSSVLLQNFLLQSVEVQARVIEHCRDCKGAFLRGFFDSEGSITESSLRVFNGDREKLEYVVRLLNSLDIETTGPHLRRERGGMVSIKSGRWNVNKDALYVYVRHRSLVAFRDRVGFTIHRKEQALRLATETTGAAQL